MLYLSELIAAIERVAPRNYQESYDNSGLIVGQASMPVTGVLVCLDTLEAVLDEAIALGCNVIIAHHPIVFSGLKSLTGKNYVERVVLKAIKNNLAIYAAHTNLDNVRTGVNAAICARLGLQNTRILLPKRGIVKQLVTYVPVEQTEAVRSALFAAGAGNIGNYSEASFSSVGAGTYKGNNASNGFAGARNVRHYEAEMRLEVVFEPPFEAAVMAALRKTHPYEEIAYSVFSLENEHQSIGTGMIGRLSAPLAEADFLAFVKANLKTDCIRHTALLGKPIETVAVCGGSGAPFLRYAKAQRADAYISADFKYHEFFDADGSTLICDVGHFESEQYTIELLCDLLAPLAQAANVPLLETKIRTNPVFYA